MTWMGRRSGSRRRHRQCQGGGAGVGESAFAAVFGRMENGHEAADGQHWKMDGSPGRRDDGKFFSAGYFFARELQQRLHVPVGILNASFGGSSVEGWTSREALAKTSDAGFAGKMDSSSATTRTMSNSWPITWPRSPNGRQRMSGPILRASAMTCFRRAGCGHIGLAHGDDFGSLAKLGLSDGACFALRGGSKCCGVRQ